MLRHTIKNVVMKEFDKLFDNYSNVLSKDCSFWLGGKGSTTGWHTDIDDLSYLYVIEGKKKYILRHQNLMKICMKKKYSLTLPDGAK
jgi:hypothetical protein